MDAAKTLKKSALLLTFALLCLTSWSSSASAQTLSACSTVALSPTQATNTCSLTVDTGSPTYTVGTPQYSDAATGWVSVTPTTGTVTAGATTTLTITLINSASLYTYSGSHSATVTVTAPSNTSTSFTVTFSPSGGGSTGSNVIAAVATLGGNSYLTFCTSTSASTQNITLSTTSNSAISFSITTPAGITASSYYNYVVSGTPVTIPITVTNCSTLVNGSTLTISYSAGTTTMTIYSGGSTTGTGSGVLAATPTTVNWSYATNGTQPSAQGIGLTESGSSLAWNAAISNQTSGDPTWLNIYYGGGDYGTVIQGVPFSNGSGSFNLLPVTSAVASLTTGSHVATVTITDTAGNSQIVTVTLTVNGSSTSNGLSVSPGSITLPSAAYGSTTQVTTSASINSTTYNGTVSVTNSGTCPGIYAGLSSSSIFVGTPLTMTVYGTPTNLAQGTYSACTLVVTLVNNNTVVATVNVPLTWVIGTGGTTTTSTLVLPTSLSFASENDSTSSIQPQAVTISSTSSWTAAPSYTNGSNWLSYTASGTGSTTTGISVNPNALSAGTYTGTVTYTFTGGGSQAVTVTLLVTNGQTVVYANQPSLSLTASSGSIIGATSFQVLTSDSSTLPFTVATSASWLTLTSSSSGSAPGFVSFSVNPSALANGVYYGAITVSTPGAANSTMTVPVVLTVIGSSVTTTGSLTVSATSMTFPAQANGSAPAAQTLTVTAPSGTTYTASATGTADNITWLTISPAGAIGNTSQTFTVTVNQGSLPVGTYTGYIYLTPYGSSTQAVTVYLTVSTTGTSSTLAVSPTTLPSFTANQGGSAPASQTLSVTSASGSSGVNFNISTTIASGATNWISVSASGYTAPATVTVSVIPTGLSAGTYTGAVVITPFNGGAAVTVPVTFTISGLPTVSAAPSTLNLAYSLGGTVPTSTINVTGSTTAALPYIVTASSTGSWLSVTPASGTTTANPTLTVTLANATSLSAGTYTGTITVAAGTGATGNTTITVTLTVTAPVPTITAIVNAASGVSGAVSPGEIVEIFAVSTNPIGPTTAVALSSATLDSNGNVPTTGLGGVTVTFNGHAAAVTYVSATQVNAVVPYEVAGFNNIPVTVKYLGQSSNGFLVQTTSSVPGIFTQNSAGNGPADVINSNGTTVNGPATSTTAPAAKGSTVSVYMTGEGATTPTGVDGKVTCGSGCSSVSQIPLPLLAVAVLVDGQPATVTFYGEAPGLVSGVMQVNFTVPSTARSGNVPLVVTVGGNSSQSNVTITLQ